MKKSLFLIALLCSVSSFGQTRFFTKKAKVTFDATSPSSPEKIRGINVDGYNQAVTLAGNGKLLGVIGHQSGYSPMPKNGTKVDNCTYSKLEAWVNNGMPQN